MSPFEGILLEDRKLSTLKAERDRYVSLAFCWADVLLELDRSFKILFVAGAAEVFFGKPKDCLIGASFLDLAFPADVPLVSSILKLAMKTGRGQEETLRLVTAARKSIWLTMTAYCLHPSTGSLYVGLRKTSPVAKKSTLPMPGIFLGEDAMTEEDLFAGSAAKRMKQMKSIGENAEITMVSIPELEALKDRLDIPSSETLEHSVHELLRANSLGGDCAADVGEGKFTLLHEQGKDCFDLTSHIEELTRQFDPTGEGAKVHSATVVTDPDDAISEEGLARGLIYVMQHFRESDGDALSLKNIAASMSDLVDDAKSRLDDFRNIVVNGDFSVVLHPIIRATSGEIHHFEALCRFGGDLLQSPFDTICFAEETGMIDLFDLAMAKKVVEWMHNQPLNNDRSRVAVNVSGFSVGKPSYVNALFKLLDDNPWTRGKLMFEITESSRMSDLDSANHFIRSLREKNYPVCLDDFGAGAASFQYLSVLDVDVVKLDGSAIRNARKATKGRAFLIALTELCRRMNVETVAEMVDTPEALNFCRDCGCDYVQGFLFGRPSPNIKDFMPLPQINLFKRSSAIIKY